MGGSSLSGVLFLELPWHTEPAQPAPSYPYSAHHAAQRNPRQPADNKHHAKQHSPQNPEHHPGATPCLHADGIDHRPTEADYAFFAAPEKAKAPFIGA